MNRITLYVSFCSGFFAQYCVCEIPLVIVGDVVVVFHPSRVFYSENPPQLFMHPVARHLGCLQLGLSVNEGSRPIL